MGNLHEKMGYYLVISPKRVNNNDKISNFALTADVKLQITLELQ